MMGHLKDFSFLKKAQKFIIMKGEKGD